MTTRESAQNSGDAGVGVGWGEHLFSGELRIISMALGYQIPFKLIPSIKAPLTKGLITRSKDLAKEGTKPSLPALMWIYFWWEVLSWGLHRAIREVAVVVHKHTRGRVGEVASWGFIADKRWIERHVVTLCCSKGEWWLSQRRWGGRERRKQGPSRCSWKPSESWNEMSKVFHQPQEIN